MSEAAQRRLAAIVSADVVGYSRLMGVDEAGTLRRLNAHRSELIDGLIDKHGGRIVKTTGDGLLLEFQSVVAAVACCVAGQEGMAERNADTGTDAIRFRIGVHLGDVIVEGEDIFGDGVNIAARLQEIGEAGGVVISSNVHDSVDGRIEASFIDDGKRELKNIARPVRVWRWSSDGGPTEVPNGPAPLPLPDDPSVAILPFDNMSGDPEQEYFADGITEDIITELSKLSGLLVISRNSAFTYKGKAAKAQDICRDLGVGCIVEGSVRKAGERVRITAQLIDGASGRHLWAERYDRELADIFAVQDDVTEKIVHALEVKLVANASDRPARVETEVPEAYDCLLRGREQQRLFTPDGNVNARRFYEKALELDPNYPAAHAGLALTCLHDWFAGSPEALDEAYDLALRANELNPSLPLVQEALGNIHLFKRRHADAVAAAQRWLEIEPGNADAYANLAGALDFSGEHAQAIPLIDKAMRLNPFYPFYYIFYRGLAYFAMERYEEALVALKRSTARNPEAVPPHVLLAACFAHLGKDAPAREALAGVFNIFPDFSVAWVRTTFTYKHAVDLDRLLEGLRRAGLQE